MYIHMFIHRHSLYLIRTVCAFRCSYLPLVLLLSHDYQWTGTHTALPLSLSPPLTHTRTWSLLHIHKYIKDRKERLQLDLPLSTVSSCSFCELCQGVTSQLKLKIVAFISMSIFISHFHAAQITCDPLCKLLKIVSVPESIAKAKSKHICICVYLRNSDDHITYE